MTLLDSFLSAGQKFIFPYNSGYCLHNWSRIAGTFARAAFDPTCIGSAITCGILPCAFGRDKHQRQCAAHNALPVERPTAGCKRVKAIDDVEMETKLYARGSSAIRAAMLS